MLSVQALFGDVPIAKFAEEHLHRLPFALAGSAGCACELGSWDALETMLAGPQENIFAVRAGEWHRETVPKDAAGAHTLGSDGYTIFIRHAERHHPGLAELAREFEATFLGPVNIHVFVTPAGAPGFSWHYDAEDVFIIQTAGEKEYSLRKNTINPWPLEETLPEDMQYEREQMPLMRVLMRGGDLLYIPCGYWHKADAKESRETAISLAVGVMSRSAMDVYDFLRKRLVQSLVWRQRLPLAGGASTLSREELESTYRQLFERLGNDVTKTITDPRFVREFIDHLSAPPTREPRSGGEEKQHG